MGDKKPGYGVDIATAVGATAVAGGVGVVTSDVDFLVSTANGIAIDQVLRDNGVNIQPGETQAQIQQQIDSLQKNHPEAFNHITKLLGDGFSFHNTAEAIIGVTVAVAALVTGGVIGSRHQRRVQAEREAAAGKPKEKS